MCVALCFCDVQVPVSTIDDRMADQKMDWLFWLKIDTEGFDPLVLQGAKNTLSNHRVAVLQVGYGHVKCR